MRKNKRFLMKAQAAIEFLATYGWAFLIILIVIGALSYFGILSPSKLLPDRCNFGSEFSCRYYTIGSNGIGLSLSNNLLDTIVINSISIYSEPSSLSCNSPIVGKFWKSGEIKYIPVFCDFSNSGILINEKDKLNAKISYYSAKSAASFSKEVSGEVFSTAQAKLIPLSGIVAYWHLNEGSGQTAKDSSGSNNDGNLVNNPSWIAGNNGNALNFDRSAWKYVDANGQSLNAQTALTLSAWVNPNDLSTPAGGDGYLTVIWGRTPSYYLSVYGPDGSVQCYWYGTSPEGYHSSGPGIIKVGEWSHILCEWDGNNINIYVNGRLRKSVAVSGSGRTTGGIRMAAEYPGRQFSGIIDEVKIYNRPLTQEEVLMDYNS